MLDTETTPKTPGPPINPIQANPLAYMTQDFLAAYRHASGMTVPPGANESAPASFQVTDFFAGISSAQTPESIYASTHTLIQSVGGIGEEGANFANSWVLGTAVVGQIRRQSVERQLTQNMHRMLAQMADGSLAVDTPFPHGSYVPGGWVEVLFHHVDRSDNVRAPLVDSIGGLLKFLDQITIEDIGTQHPTNANTAGLNQVFAEMVGAGLEVVTPVGEGISEVKAAQKLAGALREFSKTDRVPAGNGNFTPSDEIRTGHNAVRNYLRGRKDGLQELMHLVEVRFGNDLTPELRLRVVKAYRAKFGDWSGTEKDGNNNIKTEHRLAKLVLQRPMMLDNYKMQFEELAAAECPVEFIAQRAEQLESMRRPLELLKAELYKHERPNGDIVLPTVKLFEISAKLNQICVDATGMGYNDFARALLSEAEKAHLMMPRDAKYRFSMDSLVNDLTRSGLHGCHNELRQNCAFNDEAFREILKFMPKSRDAKAYGQATNKNEQLAILDRLISHPRLLQEAAQKLIARAELVAVRKRDYQDPLIKAYHTLATLGLTQEHPDCFENFVLAETREANAGLVALALQTAAQSPKNKKPHWLNIVFLFEDPEGLRFYGNIVLKAINSDSFRKFLIKMDGKLQIMLGHSDGWLRLGRIAVDGYLAMARIGKWGLESLKGLSLHEGKRSVKLTPLPFEGSSKSDVQRGGGMDPIVAIGDPHGAQNSKMLAQGSDLANFFNDPVTVKRGLAKRFVRAIKVLAEYRKVDTELELAIADAATRTDRTYKSRHMEGTMKSLLSHPLINYALTSLISNFSSRGAGRKTIAVNPWEAYPAPADLEGGRAITVSTTNSYANTVNTWYGADEFERNLAQRVSTDTVLQAKILEAGSRLFGPSMAGPLLEGDGEYIAAYTAKTLYRISSEYRRIIDRMTQGIALTDLELQHARREWGKTQGLPDGNIEGNDAKIYSEYCAAARLGSISIPARTERTDTQQEGSLENCQCWHQRIKEMIIPMEDRNYLAQLSAVLFAMHDRLIADTIHEKKKNRFADDRNAVRQLRVIHNAFTRIFSQHLDDADLAVADFIKRAVSTNPDRPSTQFQQAVSKLAA